MGRRGRRRVGRRGMVNQNHIKQKFSLIIFNVCGLVKSIFVGHNL